MKIVRKLDQSLKFIRNVKINADMIVWIVAGCFIPLTVYIVINLAFLDTTVEYKYYQRPWLSVSIIKAIYRIITRRQGKLYLKSGETDPINQEEKTRVFADKSERVVFKNCRIDDAKLKEYSQLSGGGLVFVPLCYLESLFMPSLVILATGSCFKLSPIGLIHIRQTIQVHHPLDNLIGTNFELECKVNEYRVVERGVEVDIGLSVINQIGFCVWEGVVTLLSRSQTSQKSGSARSRKISVSALDNGAISSTIRVGGDTGLNYAHATGDWNPHHLYSWSAKLLGYRQPIAHGMWVLAKMISLIQFGQRLQTYPISIEALFKRPLFMPGVADFKYSKTASNRYDFRVIDTNTAVPHLTGSVIS